MKVLLVNGSPHQEGCTHTALLEIAGALNGEGVKTEIFWLGYGDIPGCRACGLCAKMGKCIYDDKVNEIAARLGEFDGFVFGGPVHFSSTNGALCSFMDRLFYAYRSKLRGKPAAAVCSARRAGATEALERINQYFLISNMPVVASTYWNIVFGASADDARRDKEGMQTMRVLGRNMAWFLKCIDAGRSAGIAPPAPERESYRTNFIR